MMIFYAVKGPIIRRHRSRGCVKRGRKPFEHLEEEHPKEEGRGCGKGSMIILFKYLERRHDEVGLDVCREALGDNIWT